MPNYGDLPAGVGATGQAATALMPGDKLALFSAEQPAAPQASIAIACSRPLTGDYAPITFDIEFSAAPADSLVIQGAMTDTDAAYQTVYTSTNKQQDNYGDVGGFQFYRAKIVSWTGGGTLTVTVRR